MGKKWDNIVRFFRSETDAKFSSDYKPVNTLVEGFGYGILWSNIGREEALSVAPVMRGRNMICNIATLPLITVASNNVEVRNPFLEQIDPNFGNIITLTQTLEDMMFFGESWWRVTSRLANGFPQYAEHLDVKRVSITPPADAKPLAIPSGYAAEGVIWVDGEPVSKQNIIRFTSPNPPLLRYAANTISRLISLQKSAKNYADNPSPKAVFTPREGSDPNAGDPDAISKMLDEFGRQRRNQPYAYIGAALNMQPYDSLSPVDLQLSDLTKQCSLEVANFFGVDPEDVGVSTTSRTYQNGVDRRQDRINDVLSMFMKAITERLSMGDITPRGQKVMFDLDDYLRADPTTRWNNYEKALQLGVMTKEEVRAKEGLPNMPAAGTLTPDAPQGVIRVPSTTTPQIKQIEYGNTQMSDVNKMKFSSESAYQFDFEGIAATDVERRIVEGLIVPFNAVARSGGRRWKFAPGSLKFTDLKRVKLLRDHDNAMAIGYAMSIVETDDGYVARFKVASGARGDEVLALAAEGVVDGLSIGVDFEASSFSPDPTDNTVFLVRQATLKEVSLTAMPAFDNSRLTKVTASREGGSVETCQTCGQALEEGVSHICVTTPENPPAATFTAEQVQAMFSAAGIKQIEYNGQEGPTFVDPAPNRKVQVNESAAYRFSSQHSRFVPGSRYDFSTDFVECFKRGDYDMQTEAGKRVKEFLDAQFADVSTGDVTTLNPTIQRPDMYVDQIDYAYPLWGAVNKGSTINGVQPFVFPKFSSASALVGDHTEGTEPTPGTFVSTNQTVTPSALSGKVNITREVWDMGGNPAVSTLIWNQMKRAWFEGLEAATATFLNTLTAAADIALGVAVVDDALADAWDQALADLQFVRGGDKLSFFAIEKTLYKAFVGAEDGANRPLFPIINPMNANGTSVRRFKMLDLSGVTGVPSWALPQTPGSLNNSWLFAPEAVHGWASAPQRLEFPGGGSNGTTYSPVAGIDLAIWGYKAFACSDISLVRQVTYDSVA